MRDRQPATENREKKDQSCEEAKVSLKLRGWERKQAVPGIPAGKRFNVLRRTTGTHRDINRPQQELGRELPRCWKLWLSQMDM